MSGLLKETHVFVDNGVKFQHVPSSMQLFDLSPLLAWMETLIFICGRITLMKAVVKLHTVSHDQPSNWLGGYVHEILSG